jgi:hypothetical protein
MPIQRPPVAPRHKVSPVEIYWKTVTYRTVALYLLLVLSVVLAILYLIYPESFSGVVSRISQALGKTTAPTAELTLKQAKFVNLDGKVQVKKHNSVQWVIADYRMALDKDDLIQTDYLCRRDHLYRSVGHIGYGGGKFGWAGQRNASWHAHHLRRCGPGDGHMGFSKVQG